ncbi:MAG: hypothetical protein ACE5LU_15450 [Anaerolineae bacterium]
MRVTVLAVYLISASLLLVAAFVVLRVLFGRDYRRQGRLTPLSSFLGTLVFFIFGGFPYIYGPRDWPAVHVDPIIAAIGWICLAGVPVVYHEFPQTEHAFDLVVLPRCSPAAQAALYDVDRFLALMSAEKEREH